jgi:hypothetical protein
MPSDAKKKRDLAKKQAAKKGGKPKVWLQENGDSSQAPDDQDEQDQEEETPLTNGHTNNGTAEPAEKGKGDIDDIVRREGKIFF